jgi:hypothetical protein
MCQVNSELLDIDWKYTWYYVKTGTNERHREAERARSDYSVGLAAVVAQHCGGDVAEEGEPAAVAGG